MISKVAQKWVDSLGELPAANIILLGANQTEQIFALSKAFPQKMITVFDIVDFPFKVSESNVSYVVCKSKEQLFVSEFFDFILEKKPLVITNRGAWNGREQEMLEFFGHLTGRSAESLKYHLLDLGCDIKSQIKVGSLASIKDVFNSVDTNSLNQNHSLLIMKELVR
ncbi:MAG: hypothetical protein ACLGGX_07335 [Bdellovibrionia bacterium]